MNRRTFVLTGVAAGLAGGFAGCASRIVDGGTTTETPAGLYELAGSYDIPAGEFRDLALDIDDPAVLDYTADVRSGPNVDVLVLTRGEFREYSRGNEFETLEAASALDTSYGDVRADLGPTDVNVVFDNTEAGAAAPPETDGTATVDFELSVTRRDADTESS